MVNVADIHHLALFICYSFIDGYFRTIHDLYQPNAFEFNWLLQLDAKCLEPILFYLTDITFPWDWPWTNNDNPKNMLQLNFFDANNLADD